MVTDKDRMMEWLRRSADQVYSLRRKPRLASDKCLDAIQLNYSIINVLTMVARGEAHMIGIAPLDDSSKE